MIINAIRSCYSSKLYEEVAHEKDGIGLVYLFGISCILMAVLFTIVICYPGSLFMGTFKDTISKYAAALPFIPIDKSDTVLWFCIIFVLSAMSFMMTLINMAILYAMIGMVVVFILKSGLNYSQVLRLASYAQIAVYITVISVFLILSKLAIVYDGGTIEAIVTLIALFYIIFAIKAAKN